MQEIISAVKEQIKATIVPTFYSDRGGTIAQRADIIDNEFEIEYSGGVLTITNKLGRDLAIENFSSDYGYIQVLKGDGLDGHETLSSKKPFRLLRLKSFGPSFHSNNI